MVSLMVGLVPRRWGVEGVKKTVRFLLHNFWNHNIFCFDFISLFIFILFIIYSVVVLVKVPLHIIKGTRGCIPPSRLVLWLEEDSVL